MCSAITCNATHRTTKNIWYIKILDCLSETFEQNLKMFCNVPVFLMTSGLLVFPLGFESNYFRSYCGPAADMYNIGACAIGWTYVLAIVGCALSVFCPVFSYFSLNDTVDTNSYEYKL